MNDPVQNFCCSGLEMHFQICYKILEIPTHRLFFAYLLCPDGIAEP